MVLLSPEATISTDKVPYLPICRRRSSATRRAPKEPPVLGLEFIAEGVEIDDQRMQLRSVTLDTEQEQRSGSFLLAPKILTP
jgi:hypothetical protein